MSETTNLNPAVGQAIIRDAIRVVSAVNEDGGSLDRIPRSTLTTLCDAAERAETLEADCEVERMRLAACMTAALGSTPASVAQRITKDNPYWSAAYGDVCRAVDAEIALRIERDALQAQLTEVTRERDAIKATYDEFCAKFPSKSVVGQFGPLRHAEGVSK